MHHTKSSILYVAFIVRPAGQFRHQKGVDAEVAIYHNHISIVSRGKNYSAIGKIAYNHAEKHVNEYDGVLHDYTKKQNVQGVEFIKGANCPFENGVEMCKHIEKSERSSNAQLLREIEFSIPKEYMLADGTIMERGKKCAREYISEILNEHGIIGADISFHSPPKKTGKNGRRILVKDENGKLIFDNPHAHVLVPVKEWDFEKENWKIKCRKEYLWTDGKREIYSADYPADDKEVYDAWVKEKRSRSKQKTCPIPKFQKAVNEKGTVRSRRVEVSAWDNKEVVESIRTKWSEVANRYLREDGIEEISHLSNEERGIKTMPQIHLKKQDWQLMQSGEVNPSIAKYLSIEAYNKAKEDYMNLMREFKAELGRESYKPLNLAKGVDKISLEKQYAEAREEYYWLKPKYEEAVSLTGKMNETKEWIEDIEERIKQNSKGVVSVVPKEIRESMLIAKKHEKDLNTQRSGIFREVSRRFKQKVFSLKELKNVFKGVKQRFLELAKIVRPEEYYAEYEKHGADKHEKQTDGNYPFRKREFDDLGIEKVDVDDLEEIKRELQYKEFQERLSVYDKLRGDIEPKEEKSRNITLQKKLKQDNKVFRMPLTNKAKKENPADPNGGGGNR